MSEQHESAEQSGERPFSRLADDLRPSLLEGPTNYAWKANGPVWYTVVANTEGILGLLWASDEEGAAGYVTRGEMRPESTLSIQFWKAKWQDAYQRGLSPTEALADMAQQEGGYPHPGRVLPGPLQQATDLTALREDIVGDARWDPSPRDLKVLVQPVIPLHGPKLLTPEATEGMRRAARRQRGRMLFAVDPGHSPYEDVPQHGMLGGWLIDANGQLGDFHFNPTYEPTRRAMGFSPPENEVERALQAFRARRGTPEALLHAFRGADLLVSVEADGNQLRFRQDRDGERVLDVFTGNQYLPNDGRKLRTMNGGELAKGLYGCYVYINYGSVPDLRIPASDLALSAFG
ncbi:type VII secretion system-associated protein [Streptomyces sp. 351MFTsu5.1]|uniref:type VII secretion system-associated protein n=1 Tax=Streptomyces sp. 351MFTsu5.1 TaxID=1172180 RepID=UPI00035D9FAE|nr:type VII secretion system-associated protein [Streptomyces sp. 351MFTsu5.1]